MEFQRAAPVLVPLLVQIEDQIQPAMEMRSGVIVEIYVWIEFLAVQVLMRSAPDIIVIVEQIRYPGDRG